MGRLNSLSKITRATTLIRTPNPDPNWIIKAPERERMNQKTKGALARASRK